MSGSSRDAAVLACPACARRYSLDERFCAQCGMPLVYSGRPTVHEPRTEAHARARKIKPEFAHGDLVRVAGGRNQAEAEFIQGLLLEEGVPSTIKRSLGFDVPDMLAAGPRDVLVPASGAVTAREVLLDADLAGGEAEAVRPGRLLAGLLGAVSLVAVVAWVGTEVLV